MLGAERVAELRRWCAPTRRRRASRRGEPATASRAPCSRSRTWRTSSRAPRNVSRRRPVASRCSAASRPPATSSNDTEGSTPVSSTASTSTTGMPRARSRSMRRARRRRRARRGRPRPARARTARGVALLRDVVVAVADEHAVAGGGHGFLGAADQVGEERVGDVDDRHAEEAAASGAQLPRGVERHVAERVGGRAHALRRAARSPMPGRLSAFETVLIDDAGTLRDIADADSLHLAAPPRRFCPRIRAPVRPWYALSASRMPHHGSAFQVQRPRGGRAGNRYLGVTRGHLT